MGNADDLAYHLEQCLAQGNYEKMPNGDVCFFTENGEVIYEGPRTVHPIIKDLCDKILGPEDEFDFLPKEG
jgi:hypothetical protein